MARMAKSLKGLSRKLIASKYEALCFLTNKTICQYSKLDHFVFSQNQKYLVFEQEEILETLSGSVPSFHKSVTETSLRSNVFPRSYLTSMYRTRTRMKTSDFQP